MLRFTRNSALLFAAVSGALYLTGCSSEDVVTPDEKVPEASLDTDSYSVFGANQSRIHNYGASSTRAGEYVDAVDSFTMPDCPSIPATAIDLNGRYVNEAKSNEYYTEYIYYLNNGSPAAGEYYIAADATTNSGLDFGAGPVTVYVAGTLNATYLKGNGTLYVLPGGTLNYAQDWMTSEPGVKIYNYGNIKGGTLTIAGEIYSAVDITDVTNFGINNDSQGLAKLFSKGSIVAKDVRLNGECVACSFDAENEITINDKGTIKTSYFEAATLTLNAGNVILDNNGLVKVNRLNVTNQDTRFTVNGTNAVVAALEFNTNNVVWPKQIFAPEIAVDFGKYFVSGNAQRWDGNDWTKSDFEFQVSSEDQVIYVPSAGCHGEYGTKPDVPATPDEPIVEIKKVTDIDPIEEPDHGDHDHGVLSATCINFDGNTAYASYHLRGEGQKGCIEVFNDNGIGGLSLGSYMIAPDYDFNHLIVDNGNIITVGNHVKKAAFIGSLPVSFTSSENATREDFKVKQLTTDEPTYGPSAKDPNKEIKTGYENAGDGNCVVRQGDYYYVATYRGYGAINTDFSKVLGSFKKTNGSCKHISINGGTAAVLALDTYDKISSTASLWTFNADDYTFSNALATYGQIGTVAPVDGKNVVAVDGNDIYACLSTGGLVRLSDGKTFQRGTNVPVNGMAFDDKYVYVANGSFVSVLDKADLHEVCYYHASNEKSANYIALKNGKIYVAFGENGIQVYQLVEKEITE